ncbi:MAG: nuclear transport factor 2 family protein [Myxococcota bacterium]
MRRTNLAFVGILLGCVGSGALAPQEVVSEVFAAVEAGDRAQIEELVRDDYEQHSALAEDGREGLLSIVDLLQSLSVTPHRVFVDGNLVALHQTYEFPDGRRQVAFDVFRVEDGQLAEHWDALQDEVTETVSGRSMVDGPTAPAADAPTDANRALVEEFVRVILTEGQFDRLTEFVSEEMYLQHNPAVGDGLEGLGAFVAGLQEAGIAFGYRRSPLVVAEGDFVLVGSEGFFGPADDPPFAIFYDLFRVENGRIVEHWDVIPASPNPDTLPHDNGFF